MPESMAYIGRRTPCGCVVFCIAEVLPGATPERQQMYRKGMAREIGDCLKAGLTIERVTADYAREKFTVCPHQEERVGGARKALNKGTVLQRGEDRVGRLPLAPT